MKLEITETVSNLLEVEEVTTVLEIADFDTAAGKVPLSDYQAAGDIVYGTGPGAVTQLHSAAADVGDVMTLNASKLPSWAAPSGGAVDAFANHGRLTLETGVAVSTTDQATKTEVFFTTWTRRGTLIGLDNGSGVLEKYTLTQLSYKLTNAQTGTTVNGSPVIAGLTDTSQLLVGMAASGTGIGAAAVISSIDSANQVTLSANSTADGSVTVTFVVPAGRGVDFFVQRVGANNFLRAIMWTNSTTRATALTTSNGLLCPTGSTTWRYVGSVYCEAAGQTNDTVTKRHVFNYDNPVPRALVCRENTSHAYNGGQRKWNNSDTNNLLSLFLGETRRVNGALWAQIKAGADASYAVVYLYVDTVQNDNSASNFNVQYISSSMLYQAELAAGLHIFQGYEVGNHASSTFNRLEIYMGVDL